MPPAPALRAELRNTTLREDGKIEVDFVLMNDSKGPIILAERWNSWGAYQWAFRVIDKNGAKYSLINPQMDWQGNAFTTFTIHPAGEHVTRCRLDLDFRAVNKPRDRHLRTWHSKPADRLGVPSHDHQRVFSSAVREDRPARRHELVRVDHDQAGVGRKGV